MSLVVLREVKRRFIHFYDRWVVIEGPGLKDEVCVQKRVGCYYSQVKLLRILYIDL